MIGWILFFLEAAVSTAEQARMKFGQAVQFVSESTLLVRQLPGRTDTLMSMLDAFIEKPVQTISQLVEKLAISPLTANRVLHSLVSADLVTENTGNVRNRIYVCRKYIDIRWFHNPWNLEL